MVHTYFEFIHHSHFVCLKFKEFIFVWIGLKLKKIILMKRELTIGKLYHTPSLIQLLNWDKQRKQIKYIFKISFTLFLLWLLSLWNCIDLPKKKPSYMLIIQNTEKIEEDVKEKCDNILTSATLCRPGCWPCAVSGWGAEELRTSIQQSVIKETPLARFLLCHIFPFLCDPIFHDVL